MSDLSKGLVLFGIGVMVVGYFDHAMFPHPAFIAGLILIIVTLIFAKGSEYY